MGVQNGGGGQLSGQSVALITQILYECSKLGRYDFMYNNNMVIVM